jgi:hypothetical protein
MENQKIQAKLFWFFQYLDYVDEMHGAISFGRIRKKGPASKLANQEEQ